MAAYVYQAFLAPDEEGGPGYDVTFPDLPGCLTFGDDFEDAVGMAIDAARTWTSAREADGLPAPKAAAHDAPDGSVAVWVAFEASPSYVVDGDAVTASEAARMLGVSPGRVTQMIDAGQLEGWREGRRTWVALDSVNARLAEHPKAGRPRKRPAGIA